MPRFFQLPNSAIIDVDSIAAILRQDLNKYVIILKDCPAAINIDGQDLDALNTTLGTTKLKPAPEELPKTFLAVDDD